MHILDITKLSASVIFVINVCGL